MADTSKPEEVTAEQESSTSTQSTTEDDDTQQEPGGIRRVEVQTSPNTHAQTTNGQDDPYEQLRTPVAIAALVVSIFALCASFGSCYSSRQSAGIAAAVLRITQSNERPWVSAEPRLKQPFVFDKEGNIGFDIGLDVKDVGRAVAVEVMAWAEMVFLDPDGGDVAARKRQMQECEADRFPLYPIDVTPATLFLFPGVEATRLSMRVGKWAKDIAPEIARALPTNKGKVGFAIIGCVSYRAASEDVLFWKRQTHFKHQTRFLYHLVQWGDDGKFTSFITPQGIPKSITLRRMVYGNSAD